MNTNTSVQDILGADRLARLDLPIAEARGLPSEAYTSQALFELEQEHLFRRTWMGAAFAHEIPATGDALPLTIAGVEVIVLRDSEGEIRAFHNVCRHRASTVLQEPAKGIRYLQCPYHHWTYGLDGRLKAAPFWDGTPKGKRHPLDGDENALVPVRCGVWQDVIFVDIAGDAPPLEDHVKPLAGLWAAYDLESPRPFAQAESAMDANWKVVIEGALEVYHEEFVHPALTYRVGPDGAKTWEDVMVGEAMGFRSVELEDDVNRPEVALPRIPGMSPEGAVSTYVMLLFPLVTMNVYDSHVVRTIWSAPTLAETRWRSTWYFADGAAESEDRRAECQKIVDFWKAVRVEDRGATLAVQKGHQSPGPGPRDTRFSPFWEEILLHFQQHLVRALS